MTAITYTLYFNRKNDNCHPFISVSTVSYDRKHHEVKLVLVSHIESASAAIVYDALRDFIKQGGKQKGDRRDFDNFSSLDYRLEL